MSAVILAYEGEGVISIGSCTKYYEKQKLTIKYTAGDTLFLKYKAIKGKIEKITIKEIRVVSNRSIYGAFAFVYVDTMNSLYTDKDLCTEIEALNLAETYYNYQIYLAELAKNPCNIG